MQCVTDLMTRPKLPLSDSIKAHASVPDANLLCVDGTRNRDWI